MIKLKKNAKNTKNPFELIRKIALFFCISIFLMSGFFLAKELLIDPFLFDRKIDEIKDIKKESEDSNSEKSHDFEKLMEINPDIKGWIKINDTPIDYPVLQSSQEEPIFYLDKNFEKKQDKNGSIFINSYNAMFDERTQNTVMHGHSMKTGKMFAYLLKYSDIDFLKSHHIIEFDSIYEKGKWKVFAIIKTNSDEKNGPLFDYFSPNFDSQDQFLQLINDIKERSLINIPVDIVNDDKIISLSTCSYETDDARTVVFARKLRPGESESIEFDKIVKNKNPIKPQGWNKKHK